MVTKWYIEFLPALCLIVSNCSRTRSASNYKTITHPMYHCTNLTRKLSRAFCGLPLGHLLVYHIYRNPIHQITIHRPKTRPLVTKDMRDG